MRYTSSDVGSKDSPMQCRSKIVEFTGWQASGDTYAGALAKDRKGLPYLHFFATFFSLEIADACSGNQSTLHYHSLADGTRERGESPL